MKDLQNQIRSTAFSFTCAGASWMRKKGQRLLRFSPPLLECLEKDKLGYNTTRPSSPRSDVGGGPHHLETFRSVLPIPKIFLETGCTSLSASLFTM